MVFTMRSVAAVVALIGVVGFTIAADRPATTRASTAPSTTPSTKPSTKPATTKASTQPVHETVTVDLSSELGRFALRARGVMRPKGEVPAELLAGLGVMAKGRDGGAPPLLVTLADVVKFDGAFPGEKGKWDAWEAGVREAVEQYQKAGRAVVYEVAKEPDRSAFKDRLNFFSAWVRTGRVIRAVAPEAVIMGPSIAKHDGGWVGEFLKVAKEWDVLPDVVCWHEDGLRQDLAGHVGGAAESFWQDGTNRREIVIGPSAAVEGKHAAGDPAIFMGQMEKSVKAHGWRPIEQVWWFKLTHLVTAEGRPRSVYYTYKAYADLAARGGGGGVAVKVSSGPTVDGVAVASSAERTCRVLIGRNRSRVDSKHILGDVTLAVKGADAAGVGVRATRIADSGAKASDGPVAVFEREVAVKGGEAKVPLTGFVPGDAWLIELTLRGTGATTRPAGGVTGPTTRPTAAAAAASSNSDPRAK
jgi:hypothetical protein